MNKQIIRCENCIHNGVCCLQEICENIDEELDEFGCEDFADKSLYIKLPRKECKNKTINPLTVTQDRYSGVFASYMSPEREIENCRYTAWNLTVDEVPTEIEQDDVTCRNFWIYNKIPCGRGATVEKAIKDLINILNN